MGFEFFEFKRKTIMKINLYYELYKTYAEIASRYYAFKDHSMHISSRMVCNICGKAGHGEKYCLIAWRMGFIDKKL